MANVRFMISLDLYASWTWDDSIGCLNGSRVAGYLIVWTFGGTKVVGIFVGAGGVVSKLLGQTFAAASHDCFGGPLALDVVL